MRKRFFQGLFLACLLLTAGCVSVPSNNEFSATRAVLTVDVPGPPVIDGRAAFRQVFCSVLRRDGLAESDDHQCTAALWKLVDEPDAPHLEQAVEHSPSALRWFVVTGALSDCLGTDALPFLGGIAGLTDGGSRIELIKVSGLSGSAHNARLIAEALQHAGLESTDRVALLGYSKGAVDILEFLTDFPDLASGVVAVVSVSGPILGSPLASKAEWAYQHLLSSSRSRPCEAGDAELVNSLSPRTRHQWLIDHPLPIDVRFFSLAAFTTSDRLSRGLRSTWRSLAAADTRNDGQVSIGDAVIPGSTMLGYANADHWGVALTIENELPRVAARKDPRPFPQDQLLEAIVRFVGKTVERP